ncbi:hypothetical protein MAR_033471 [Mya arenaria]|uniref:Uncharacterized protein n=1 Tax=Mya arenaria TaxID=6604 RepID=A0ABY7GBG4_MYAAR|nr:hypothetical protein MAR_033471 [Mya arenaria]
MLTGPPRWCLKDRQGINLPQSTGKENWNVWLKKFEAFIKEQESDIVFSQVTADVLGANDVLVAEITGKCRIIETE